MTTPNDIDALVRQLRGLPPSRVRAVLREVEARATALSRGASPRALPAVTSAPDNLLCTLRIQAFDFAGNRPVEKSLRAGLGRRTALEASVMAPLPLTELAVETGRRTALDATVMAPLPLTELAAQTARRADTSASRAHEPVEADAAASLPVGQPEPRADRGASTSAPPAAAPLTPPACPAPPAGSAVPELAAAAGRSSDSVSLDPHLFARLKRPPLAAALTLLVLLVAIPLALFAWTRLEEDPPRPRPTRPRPALAQPAVKPPAPVVAAVTAPKKSARVTKKAPPPPPKASRNPLEERQ